MRIRNELTLISIRGMTSPAPAEVVNDFESNVLFGERREMMADDKTKRGPQDVSKINLHEDYEVEYWTKELGVSRDELETVMKRVGSSAKAVREALGDGHR